MPLNLSGMPVDVLTGFITEDGDARGRLVGVAIDKQGALLVADDVGNTIWARHRSVGYVLRLVRPWDATLTLRSGG